MFEVGQYNVIENVNFKVERKIVESFVYCLKENHEANDDNNFVSSSAKWGEFLVIGKRIWPLVFGERAS